MNRFGLLVAALSSLASPGVDAASLYKCEGEGGAVAYQDAPCAGGQRQSTPTLRREPPPAAASDLVLVDSLDGRPARVTRRGEVIPERRLVCDPDEPRNADGTCTPRAVKFSPDVRTRDGEVVERGARAVAPPRPREPH